MLFKKLYGKVVLFLTNYFRIINKAIGETAACISKVLVQVKILFATGADHIHYFKAICHKHAIL